MATVTCVDMHTNGEPLRILVDSRPPIAFPAGATIVEKRRHLLSKADWLRRVLMREPRGHSDMYGAVLTDPDRFEDPAHFAVLFCHNEGYSTMCGHGTIALARYAVDRGLVSPVEEPETRVAIQCPCGVAEAFAEVRDGKSTGRVRFVAPMGYLHAADVSVQVDGRAVEFDLVYGGAFYALFTASDLGLDLRSDPADRIIDVAMRTKRLVQQQHPIKAEDKNAPHDYLFLYGLILTDARRPESVGARLEQVIVFAEGQIDRSPCGSGSAARLSALASRGSIKIGQQVALANPLVGEQSQFIASVVSCGGSQVPMGTEFVKVENAVQCEISGQTFYTAESKFILEEKDVFPEGFLVRT